MGRPRAPRTASDVPSKESVPLFGKFPTLILEGREYLCCREFYTRGAYITNYDCGHVMITYLQHKNVGFGGIAFIKDTVFEKAYRVGSLAMH